ALGYQLTAIVRIKPAPGRLPRIPELAAEIPEVGECHRITGEDCFYLKLHLRSIDELSGVLDRFLVYGETTTSLVNATPIPRRDPPLDVAQRRPVRACGGNARRHPTRRAHVRCPHAR